MPFVLSNDDGVHAEGLATLSRLLAEITEKSECLVVAPSGPQSGVGHAVTTRIPMRLEQLSPRRFALDGTPADCARVALGRGGAFAQSQFAEPPLRSSRSRARPSDHTTAFWMVSGINHGANLGVDVYISGTAAAAREAAILGFPAIAISQYVGRHRAPDWAASAERARPVLEQLLAIRPKPGAFWNINLPHPADESTDSDLVFCPVDPSPHAFEYEDLDGALHWRSDFHSRPRMADHDIDVCMGGRVSVSEVPLGPGFSENS